MSASLRRLCLLALAVAVRPVVVLAGETGNVPAVSPYWALAFVLLLLSIPVAPFINRHWWEKYYPHVAIAFGLITLLYYLFGLQR